jgi:hypothetical protein
VASDNYLLRPPEVGFGNDRVAIAGNTQVDKWLKGLLDSIGNFGFIS